MGALPVHLDRPGPAVDPAAEQGLAGTPIALQGQLVVIDTRREAIAGGLQVHPAADVADRHGPAGADRRHVARQLSRDAELDLDLAVLEHRRHRRQFPGRHRRQGIAVEAVRKLLGDVVGGQAPLAEPRLRHDRGEEAHVVLHPADVEGVQRRLHRAHRRVPVGAMGD